LTDVLKIKMRVRSGTHVLSGAMPDMFVVILILLCECCFFETSIISAVAIYQRFEAMVRRPRIVIFPGSNLTNVSLGLNYGEGFRCTERDGYMSFTPNRRWHNGRYSVLFVLAIFYPLSSSRGVSIRQAVFCRGLLQSFLFLRTQLLS
jgi:hypothetical protein